MGKQSRRKRQPKKGGNKQQQTSSNSAKSSTLSSPSSSGSLLLQRLRHADPRTRHAALAALATTHLDPETLMARSTKSSSSSLPSISTDLLQAIRERIMDDDLECAQAAAGCLHNYVSFCPSPKQDLCAGWTVILVGRLQQCRDMLHLQQQQQQQQQRPSSFVYLQWMALTVQCLQMLCTLVETNPLALERIEQQSLTSSSSSADVLQVLLDLLSMATVQRAKLVKEEEMQITGDTAVAAVATVAKHTSSSSSSTKNKDLADASTMLPTIAIYAARTLHSALDDNTDLLFPWLLSSSSSSSSQAAKVGLELLQQCCAASGADSTAVVHHVPAVAQLHCAGCIVTARQQVLLTTTTTNTTTKPSLEPWAHLLQDMVLLTVVPMLRQYLLHHDSDDPSASQRHLLEQYVQAKRLYQQEVADSQLERDVIRQVEQRHEPARSIARRQKGMKKNRPMEDDDNDDNDDKKQQQQPAGVMKEEGEDETMQDIAADEKTAAAEAANSKKNQREALDEARQAFHLSLLPLQLALEITANLTSTPSDDVDQQANNNDDDDDRMDDDDADYGHVKSLVPSKANDGFQNHVALADIQLMNTLVEQRIPDQVLTLLQNVCSPTFIPTLNGSVDDVDDNSSIPVDAMEEIASLISKCAGCLGNCLANLTSSWQLPSTLWMTLRECVTAVNSSKQLALTPTDANDGIWTAMAIAAKSHESVRKQIRQEDIEWLLTQLQQQAPSSPPMTAVRQGEIVAILGVWCREETHSAELNSKVCNALVSLMPQTTTTTDSSLMVMNEMLNALMDMYGNDDHGSVFESLQVLSHFQRMLPLFERRIQCAENEEVEEREWLDQCHETALNAERFIRYKKN